MAVNDHSLGPVYFARYRLPRRWTRPFIGGITQMIEPWRKGKALILPSGPFRSALAFGWWRKMPVEDFSEDFEDEQWLSPRHLAMFSPSVISSWDNGPDVEKETEARVQRT